MEWLLIAAPVRGAIDFELHATAVLPVLLATALVPAALALRQALGLGRRTATRPVLRVVPPEKEKTLSQRAA